MRVAICCRWSDDDGGANSLADQERWGREDAERNGWDVAGVFVADGCSGKSMFRPDILGVTELIERDAVDIIWYKDSDRFTRNDRATEQWFEDVLEPANARRAVAGLPPIQLHFRYGVNGDESADSNVWFMRKQLRVFGEKYRRDLVVKVQGAMDNKRAGGYWISRPPFGTVTGGQRGIPVRDPVAWPRLLWIFEEAAAGRSLRSIAIRLNELGVARPQGGKWTQSNVGYIVRNFFYSGWRPGGVRLLHNCTVPREVWERANAGIRKCGERDNRAPVLLRGLAVSSHYRYADNGQPVPLRYRKGRGYVPVVKDVRESYARAVIAEPGAPSQFAAADYERRFMDYVLARIDSGGPAGFFAEVESELDLAREAKQRELEQARRDYDTLSGSISKAQRRLDRALDAGLDKAVVRRYGETLADLQAGLKELVQRISYTEAELRDWPDVLDFEQRLGRVNLLRACWDDGDIAACNTLLRCFVGYVDLRRDGFEVGFMVELGAGAPSIHSPIRETR